MKFRGTQTSQILITVEYVDPTKNKSKIVEPEQISGQAISFKLMERDVLSITLTKADILRRIGIDDDDV